MATVKSTSVEVTFDGSAYVDDGQGGGPSLEVSSKKPEEDNFVYFRAHGCSGCTLISTSGNVHRVDSNLKKFTSEFVYFNNDTEGRLRYPQAINPKVELMGNLITPEGLPVDDTKKVTFLKNSTDPFTFNAAKNAIVSSVGPVYAVFLVEYYAPYDLWKATFAGNCPSTQDTDPVDVTKGDPDDETAYEGRMPMIVFAKKVEKVVASLNLSPPPCSNQSDIIGRSEMGLGAGQPRLQIVEDPQYKPKFDSWPAGVIGLSPRATTRVRIYPSGEGTLTSNSGSYRLMESGLFAQVRTTLSFSGSSSEKLQYTPSGSVAVYIQGSFRDIWGRTFTPSIRLPGDSITVVEWITKSTYKNPISRTVQDDELAIADPSGKAIPCYGNVEVAYTSSYDQWEFSFDWDNDQRWFVPAFAIAKPSSGDLGGDSILLSPPSSRGA